MPSLGIRAIRPNRAAKKTTRTAVLRLFASRCSGWLMKRIRAERDGQSRLTIKIVARSTHSRRKIAGKVIQLQLGVIVPGRYCSFQCGCAERKTVRDAHGIELR